MKRQIERNRHQFSSSFHAVYPYHEQINNIQPKSSEKQLLVSQNQLIKQKNKPENQNHGRICEKQIQAQKGHTSKFQEHTFHQTYQTSQKNQVFE